MTTKKPAVKKVTKRKVKVECLHHTSPTLGCDVCRPKYSGKKELLKTIRENKSRFADKDFDFKQFPSQKKVKLQDIDCPCGSTCKKCKWDGKTTAFPYEIDTEPIVQGCTKWQAMLIALALALFLVATAHGDFEALTSNLIH